MRPTPARLVLVASAMALGCSMSTTLPRVTLVDSVEGFKMLKPAATTTECRGAAFWDPSASSERDLAALALRRLLESDDEADAIVNVRVEWTSWSVGVYGRRCVTLTGDVVRSIRTVRLPMPGHHADHTGHQR